MDKHGDGWMYGRMEIPGFLPYVPKDIFPFGPVALLLLKETITAAKSGQEYCTLFVASGQSISPPLLQLFFLRLS